MTPQLLQQENAWHISEEAQAGWSAPVQRADAVRQQCKASSQSTQLSAVLVLRDLSERALVHLRLQRGQLVLPHDCHLLKARYNHLRHNLPRTHV